VAEQTGLIDLRPGKRRVIPLRRNDKARRQGDLCHLYDSVVKQKAVMHSAVLDCIIATCFSIT
jgi:hypothetical protein